MKTHSYCSVPALKATTHLTRRPLFLLGWARLPSPSSLHSCEILKNKTTGHSLESLQEYHHQNCGLAVIILSALIDWAIELRRQSRSLFRWLNVKTIHTHNHCTPVLCMSGYRLERWISFKRFAWDQQQPGWSITSVRLFLWFTGLSWLGLARLCQSWVSHAKPTDWLCDF